MAVMALESTRSAAPHHATRLRTGSGDNMHRQDGKPPGHALKRMLPRAVALAATALTLLLAFSLACTPLALATTGVTSNVDAKMTYYYGANQEHSKHYLHKLGDDWVYCVEPYDGFATGITCTGEDPVATGKLSQKCVTDLALAYRYVWDEGLYRTPTGAELANDYERYAAAQVLIWSILVDYYPSLGPKHNRITVDGKDVTGDGTDDANNKAAYRWIAEHRGSCIGHCEYFDAKSHQSFAMAFVCEGFQGTIALEKHSGKPAATDGNSNYTLEGAAYGVYSDEACTNLVTTLVTDTSGKAQATVDTGTYYVKETTPPAGYNLDGSVYTVAVASDAISYVNGTAGVLDMPQLGSIALSKKSANESITADNACYSLTGAEFGVFSDGACTRKVGSLVTDGGGTARIDGLPLGTYYVKETKAPKGFAVNASSYAVEVTANGTPQVNGEGGVADIPQTNEIELFALKRDAETADGTAQGSATLASAEFTISYYDGYHELDGLPTNPKRTWVVKTDAKGFARADDEHRIGGDSFYRTAEGKVTLPLGTYLIEETGAPQGYRLGNGSGDGVKSLVQVTSEGVTGPKVSSFSPAEVADEVQRGGIAVGKVDRQNGAYLPQGSATLEGATFEIVTNNDQQVVVEGASYAKGSVVKTMTTVFEDGLYVARTDDDCLPVGSYTVRETASSVGYLYDEESRDWSHTFQITADGDIADLTDPENAVGNLAIRGDFEFSKVDGQTSRRLANIPFLITSQTTGEQHVIVTDENGMASTASSWNSHRTDTNANDAAVLGNENADGGSEKTSRKTTDEPADGGQAERKPDKDQAEQLADETAGGDRSARTADAAADGTLDDELDGDEGGEYDEADAEDGEEPFDNEVDEGLLDEEDDADDMDDADQPDDEVVTAKKGGPLDESIDLEVANDGEPTSDNQAASTVSDNRDTDAVSDDGDPEAAPTGRNELAVDEGKLNSRAGVWFSGRADEPCDPDDSLGALPYDTYTVRELRCKANEGFELVEFETVITRNNRELDLGTIDDNAGPSISTSLGDGNGAKLVAAGQSATLVDTVTYMNLDTRRTYTLTGQLHAVDEDGTDCGIVGEASAQLTPSAPTGTAEVLFTIDLSDCAAYKLVATEQLLDENGTTICNHEDLSDEAQSVYVPSIATVLSGVPGNDEEGAATASDEGVDTTAGDKNTAVSSVGTIELVDTVTYTGLAPGKTYTMQASLHTRGADGADEGMLLDASGQAVTARQSFTPAESDGKVEVTFLFEAPDIGGKTVVAFEELQFRDVTYATHADISDEAQSLALPSIGTTLADSKGAKSFEAANGTVLIDTVEYENLVPKARYTLVGTLHAVDKDTGDEQPLLDDQGNQLTSRTIFTTAEASGQTSVEFNVDSSALGNKKIVAFETLLDSKDTVVAVHEDVNDESQTVFVTKPDEPESPEDETPSTIVENGNHSTMVTVVNKQQPAPGKGALKAGTIAKTGDTLKFFALALVPAALLGMALSFLAIKKMRESASVSIPRGRHKAPRR